MLFFAPVATLAYKLQLDYHKKVTFSLIGCEKLDAVPKNMEKLFFFGPKIFLFTYPDNPIIAPETDPTQWDHIFPISSGNSGCLRFSIRCPFNRLAGRNLALIAQNGLRMCHEK